MNFTILSHAGILIEHNGVQIIADPWLTGSCYWRSWWNFPEPTNAVLESLKPDYIYLTHLHWDHFHGISLQKFFDPKVHILVPKVPTRRMVEDLNWLGFHNITEIEHNGAFDLGEDFVLRSYQSGLSVDSAMLVTGGGITLFNCNDCKCFGLPLKQITSTYPKIDFVFRSHSSATPIPYCIDGFETTFPDLRKPSEYIEEFSYFGLFINARYAIPFASNHCFLHRETFNFNKYSVLPNSIPQRYEQLAAELNKKSECIVMSPGSSWSDTNGFKLISFDYSNKDEYLQTMLERHHDKLITHYQKEAETLADFESFRIYFENFIKSLPFIARKYFKLQILFHITDKQGEHFWLIDTLTMDIKILKNNDNVYPTIKTPALVLNDCCKQKMFSTWAASKLLKIFLPAPSQLKSINIFFMLLDLYELDTLPLMKNFTLRSVSVRLLRWREIVEAVHMIFKYAILKRPFIIKNLYS